MKFIRIFLIYIIFPVMIAVIFTYISMYLEMRTSDRYGGFYNPITNLYVCEAQFFCYHEQGHAYDNYNTPLAFFFVPVRSMSEEFRVNINIINNCMSNFYNGIGHNPKEHSPDFSKTKVLAYVYSASEYYHSENYEENRRYEEIYADAYAIMKLYRWDEYHYDDAEDMIAYKADYCQSIQAEAIANE